MYKVVVFDCDGVMFDTAKANRMYYNSILEHFNRPPLTREQFDYVHMSTVREAIRFLFTDDEKLEDVFAFCREMSYNPLIPHMDIEPDLIPLLHYLRADYKTAIATNRSTTMAGVMEYHGLTELFDLVVTSLDVVHAKPHPDQLHKIMNHFEVLPSEVIFIGDSRTDEAAAGSACVHFAAFRNPALKARYHITELLEVKAILASDDSSESVYIGCSIND